MRSEIRDCERRRRNRSLHHLIRTLFFFFFSLFSFSVLPSTSSPKRKIRIDNVLLARCATYHFLFSLLFSAQFKKLNFIRVQHEMTIKRVERWRWPEQKYNSFDVYKMQCECAVSVCVCVSEWVPAIVNLVCREIKCNAVWDRCATNLVRCLGI